MRQNQVVANIEIENFSDIGIYFEPFVHQDIGLNTQSPVFNLFKELLVLFAICLVQLVQDRIAYHFKYLF